MSAEGKSAGRAAEHVIAKAVAEAGVRDAEEVAAKRAVEKAGAGAAERAAGSTVDRELLAELERTGVKHDPAAIVRIARGADGKVVFLEKGNSRAGLQHIVEEHADDFARKGVPEEDIPDLVMDAVTKGNVVGQQGSRPPLRTIYEVEYEGKPLKVAVSTGSNGFVVGANPR